MYNESIKSNNPSTEKDTRCKVHSYKVFKNKYFNFTTLSSWFSKQEALCSLQIHTKEPLPLPSQYLSCQTAPSNTPTTSPAPKVASSEKFPTNEIS